MYCLGLEIKCSRISNETSMFIQILGSRDFCRQPYQLIYYCWMCINHQRLSDRNLLFYNFLSCFFSLVKPRDERGSTFIEWTSIFVHHFTSNQSSSIPVGGRKLVPEIGTVCFNVIVHNQGHHSRHMYCKKSSLLKRDPWSVVLRRSAETRQDVAWIPNELPARIERVQSPKKYANFSIKLPVVSVTLLLSIRVAFRDWSSNRKFCVVQNRQWF